MPFWNRPRPAPDRIGSKQVADQLIRAVMAEFDGKTA